MHLCVIFLCKFCLCWLILSVGLGFSSVSMADMPLPIQCPSFTLYSIYFISSSPVSNSSSPSSSWIFKLCYTSSRATSCCRFCSFRILDCSIWRILRQWNETCLWNQGSKCLIDINLKEFDSLVPGHGGMTDRMDCQFIMGLFTYVYCTALLEATVIPTDNIVQLISQLPIEDQLTIFSKLSNTLVSSA